MWLSRDKEGCYCLHKNEPIYNSIDIGDGVIEEYWTCKHNQNQYISEWIAVELCNIFNIRRPLPLEKVNLPVHKARMYSYNWFLLLTREWDDLKKCLK